MKGLSHWLWQRFTALFLLSYILYLSLFIFLHQELMTFDLWSNFMQGFYMKVMTLIALLFLCIHAWIGCRTIATDYIKCTMSRVMLLGLYGFLLITCFVSGFVILWR